MGNCRFINNLNKLRKSSSDSIDDVNSFDSFKKYMHVERNVEVDLISILKHVEETGRKTLVLVCGSAGDGKSHLLSYLKNEVQLLNGYKVYNDATESSMPTKTAIETLNEELKDFKDENLELPGQNIIMAINLGVLSNFIESEFGASFTNLKAYVEQNHILTNELNYNVVDENSSFQYVSFSDYHMYHLSEDGPKPVYIEQLLEKVFAKNEENTFYRSYTKNCCGCSNHTNCPIKTRCPVKHNFEYLTIESNRKYVAQSLVEVIIKDKEVLTTREILNYIYDIVVPQGFQENSIVSKSIIDDLFLNEYIKDITPMLMYEYQDVSNLMNKVKRYDPVLCRSQSADKDTILYYVTSDVSDFVTNIVKNTPYNEILGKKNVMEKINKNKNLKLLMFNVITRIQVMKKELVPEVSYSKFVRSLYFYNAGIGIQMRPVYNLVNNAVRQWCGYEDDDNICLKEMSNGISLYENIRFNADISDLKKIGQVTELQKFRPTIGIKYTGKKGEVIDLQVDYSLYSLLHKLTNGYIQTADDRNNHANFVSFVNKILKTGTADESLLVILSDGTKAKIENGQFGYTFKRVK